MSRLGALVFVLALALAALTRPTDGFSAISAGRLTAPVTNAVNHVQSAVPKVVAPITRQIPRGVRVPAARTPQVSTPVRRIPSTTVPVGSAPSRSYAPASGSGSGPSGSSSPSEGTSAAGSATGSRSSGAGTSAGAGSSAAAGTSGAAGSSTSARRGTKAGSPRARAERRATQRRATQRRRADRSLRGAIRRASGCLGAVGDRERRFLVAFAGLGGGHPMSTRDAARVAEVPSRRAGTFRHHAVRALMSARRGGTCGTSAPSAALLLLGDEANRLRMLALPADAADGDYAPSLNGRSAVTGDAVNGEDGAAGGSGNRDAANGDAANGDAANGDAGGVTAGSTGNELPGAAARAGGDEGGGLPAPLLFLLILISLMALGALAMRTGAFRRSRRPARGVGFTAAEVPVIAHDPPAVPVIVHDPPAHEASAPERDPEDTGPERPVWLTSSAFAPRAVPPSGRSGGDAPAPASREPSRPQAPPPGKRAR